jgi:hypothetical protein
VAGAPGPNPDPIGVDPPSPPSTPQIAVLVGAGDIADCGASDRGINAEATAKLLDKVFVGAGTELQHDPTFQRLLPLIRARDDVETLLRSGRVRTRRALRYNP